MIKRKKFYLVEVISNTSIEEDTFLALEEFKPLGIWFVNENCAKIFFRRKEEKVKDFLKRINPAFKIRSRFYKERNWVYEYEKKLKPIEIGKKFVIIHFSEIEKIKEVNYKDRFVIKLIPSEAFGTGEHFTTSSCIEMLEHLDPFPKKVLDVGTGSGILSICASYLGAKEIFAFDFDYEAVRVAKESSLLNGRKISIFCSTINSIKTKFDLIVANILAETLIEISDEIMRISKKGSKIILSGIIKEKEEDVLRCFDSKGFEVKEKISNNEWVTILYSR